MNETLVPLPLKDGLALFTNVYMPSRDFSEWTREAYERDVEQLIDLLRGHGRDAWQQVTLADLQAHMARLDKEGLEKSSRRRKVYAIKSFFKFLVGNGHIKQNPAEALIPPKRQKKDPRYLSEIEYNTFLAQISHPRDKAVAMLFLQTGMRLSELAALTLGDLQLPKRVSKSGSNIDDVGYVRIERKGSDIERLPLNWKACEALNIYLKERKKKATTTQEDAVFLNKYDKPLSRRAIYNMIKKYLAQADIEDASVHTLRSTAATMYAAKGGNIKEIQALLGHKSLETTSIYVGLGKRELREMVQDNAL